MLSRPHRRVEDGVSIDDLIDRFVKKVNGSNRDPVIPDVDGTPPSVLYGTPGSIGDSDWRIKPYVVDWIEPLEAQIGFVFPTSYRSLVTRYIFPGFQAGKVYLFGNTPEGACFHEMRDRLSRDEAMAPFLLQHGFVQIGCPDQGNYDPICMDHNRPYGSGDLPLVQFWHEDVVRYQTPTIKAEVASSFEDFVAQMIS